MLHVSLLFFILITFFNYLCWCSQYKNKKTKIKKEFFFFFREKMFLIYSRGGQKKKEKERGEREGKAKTPQ